MEAELILAAERGRCDAEAIRQSQETVRQGQESTRVKSEEARAAADENRSAAADEVRETVATLTTLVERMEAVEKMRRDR